VPGHSTACLWVLTYLPCQTSVVEMNLYVPLQENVLQVRSFKPGSISAAELRSLADSLRRQSPAAAYRHAPLLQLAEAAAAALEGPHAGEPLKMQLEGVFFLMHCSRTRAWSLFSPCTPSYQPA